MKTSRKVIITERSGMYFVTYTDRHKYGRYTAAQFDKTQFSYVDVKNWIASNPELQFDHDYQG